MPEQGARRPAGGVDSRRARGSVRSLESPKDHASGRHEVTAGLLRRRNVALPRESVAACAVKGITSAPASRRANAALVARIGKAAPVDRLLPAN